MTHCPNDGSPLVQGDGPSTMVERVVGGRYRLLGLVGEGGMGTVYAAEHNVSLRRVALKIIKPELESSGVARGRFLRECQLLERIDSPYVVKVMESGESKKGEIFLVMELLEGMSLGDRLETVGALPPQEAVRVSIQIVHALAAAHSEGIVHRDLKPDNIFLCEDGTVRVLDFGIARLLDGVTLDASSRKLTATGTIVGTPAYISPEGAAGGFIGPAADLYSFGVLLYEMLKGELPFWDSHPVLMMGMHLKEPAPKLDPAELGLPPALATLVAELLEKKPEERPPGADVVLSRLEALRGRDGTLVMDALDTIPAGRGLGSSRKVFVPVVAGALVLFGLMGGAAIWAGSSDGEEEVTAIEAEAEVDVPPPLPVVDPVEEPAGVLPPLGVDEPEVDPAEGETEPAEEGAEGDPVAETADPDPQPRRRVRRGNRRRGQGQPQVRPLQENPNMQPANGRGRNAGGMIRDYW